jgi:hypothetical protein
MNRNLQQQNTRNLHQLASGDEADKELKRMEWKNNQANKRMLTPRHLQRAHLLTEGTQHDSPESTLEFEDSSCSIPGA